MNAAHPFRLALIAAAFVLSLLALSPNRSTDISITDGNPTAQLTLVEQGLGFSSRYFQLSIDDDGEVGKSANLTATLKTEDGEVLQTGLTIGADYKAGTVITTKVSDGPEFRLTEGVVAKGTTYHLSYLVEYMNLGLDLVGGSEIEYRIPLENLGAGKKVDLSEIVGIFNRKLNNSGLKEIYVQPIGQDRILIQLPGLKKSEVEKIKATIEKQGNLEFKIAETDPKLMEQAKDYVARGKTLPLGSNFPYVIVYQQRITPTGLVENIPGTEILVSAKAKVTGRDIEHAYKGLDSQSLRGGYSIHINFSPSGRDKFGDLTEASVGKRLAIILDGALQSAPNVNEPILGGQCQITGSFSESEADSLVTVLRSGSMDVKPELLTENTVGPSLGSDSITSGIKACIFGAIFVLAFMFIYYRSLGAIANVALVLNMVMLQACMVLFGGTLTLPGIAGFALTIGMAVDATVLIFERMREESLKKQHIKVSLSKSYQRAFVTIFDSNFTTFITALILFWVGNSGPVKGFCLSLMLGLAINLFAAVFVTQTLVTLFVNNGKMKSFNMTKEFFANSQINFFVLGKKVILGSYLIIIIGIIMLIAHGKNVLDVDFTGGNLLQISLEKSSSVDTVRKVVADAGYNSAIVQAFGGSDGMNYTVRTPPLTQIEKINLQDKMLAELPLPKDTSKAFPRDITVGGVAATEMLGMAMVALIAAMLVILMYIMIRFSEFKYGLGACLALVHDVFVVLSLLMIFNIQINLTIFAALLTVVGYSLNDTIVIFDRIRENIGMQKKYDFKTIANISLNQTLSRTVITGLTTTFVIISLMFIGGGVIEGFATTMLFGVIVGTYSSLFVATPFVYFLYKKDKYAMAQKEGDKIPQQVKADPAGTV
jgi:SecD/SecF fusion protein